MQSQKTNAMVKNDTKKTVLDRVKELTQESYTKQRFKDVLGQKTEQFLTSIVNAVAASEQLQKVKPRSIMAAAFVAAAFDLPVDSNLGFAAIVPYNDKAQFQMMYKGFIQLAIRSGYYERMNYSSIYEDELKSYNPITGEVEFANFSECKQRNAGEDDKIVGYYAWFRLKTGFISELYMSRADVENHARKYSKSYQYDIRQKRSTSKWSTDFDAMAKKTVIKLLLSKWGILSVSMQKAMDADQKVYDENESGSYADNERALPETVTDPFLTAGDVEEADEQGAEEAEETDEPEEVDITGEIE